MEISDKNSKKKLSVILTGGEPFIYSEQVFSIADFCKKNSLNCFVNTNGKLINPIIKEIMNSGLSAVTISLDSHLNSIHDNLRGSRGLFNEIIKMIEKIIKIKKEKGFPIKICVQSILGNWNINILDQHLEFYKKLEIDCIMF